MFFALLFVNIIEEINSSEVVMNNLLQTNTDLAVLKRKPNGKTKKKQIAKSGENKKIRCTGKGKNTKCYNIKNIPFGPNYMQAPGNNVFIITINFYIRLLIMIGDQRDFATISKNVAKTCNKINIFQPIRESVLNCRAVARSIKNKSAIRSFYMGCMANLLSLVKEKCPTVFDKKTSGSYLSAAIIKLTQVNPKIKYRLQVAANIFMKNLSFFSRVFSNQINKRMIYLNKLKVLAEKKKAMEKAKRAKFLADKIKKIKENKGKNSGKKSKDKKEKENPKKKIECKHKCRQGMVCSKVCKRIQTRTDAKFSIPKNAKDDEKLVKEMGLDTSKGQHIAALFGKWIENILNFKA
jgi:hypothetical protein